MSERACLLLVLLATISLVGCENSTPLPENYYDLSGPVKYQTGDDPNWASTTWDDSQWDTHEIPESWLSVGLPWNTTFVWYRFNIPTKELQNFSAPAFYCDQVVRADECFLNGNRLGGMGLENDRKSLPAFQPRLYRIPEEAILKEEPIQILAIRTCSPTVLYDDGGFTGNSLGVGEYDQFLTRVTATRFQQQLNEMATFILLLVFVGCCSLFWAVSPQDRDMFWAAVAGVIACYVAILESQWGAGLVGISTLSNGLILFLDFLATPLLLGILCRLIERKWSGPVLLLTTLDGVLLVGIIPILFEQSLNQNLLVLLIILVTLLLVLYLIFCAGVHFRKADLGRRVFLSGIQVVVFTYLIELLFPNSSTTFMGLNWTWYGCMFFVLSFLGMVIIHYRDAVLQAKRVSRSILEGQSEERRRLGRELHDGVMQSLLAAQLELEMLRSNQQNQATDEVQDPVAPIISSLKSVSKEIRNLSRDLRPEHICRLSLPELIEYHLEAIKSELDFEVKTRFELETPVDPSIRDHLYRIAQEAIRNILRHAMASHVEIHLSESANLVELRIQDDGVGIADLESQSTGAGLAIMKERAALLNGTCQIRSRLHSGTQITIQVPKVIS